MVDPGIIGLSCVLIIIFIVAIVMLSVFVYKYIRYEKSQGGNATAQQPCSQAINVSGLIQIPDSQLVCWQNGLPTSYYYVGNLNPKFNYIVAPYPTQNVDVCVRYCSQLINGGECIGASGQTGAQANFNACMAQLSSQSCLPPLPIAAQGSVIYYPLSPTSSGCDPPS